MLHRIFVTQSKLGIIYSNIQQLDIFLASLTFVETQTDPSLLFIFNLELQNAAKWLLKPFLGVSHKNKTMNVFVLNKCRF